MKIGFQPKGCVPSADLDRNIAYSRSLNLPVVTLADLPRGSLAVIGGAPSIRQHVDELQSFPGERWIIGTAFGWCRDHDIDGTYFCIDPLPEMAKTARGARHALLSNCCHPDLFDALLEDGCHIETFEIGGHSVPTGSTTATAAPYLGLMRGHDKIYFYGCDSCYTETTHAYQNLEEPLLLQIKLGDGEYLSSPQMILQAEELTVIMREHPGIYIDRSGGLLGAMLKHGTDWDVLKVSRALSANLEKAS
jgi:hypothetical protein